jgi:dihydroneopterin aldolase
MSSKNVQSRGGQAKVIKDAHCVLAIEGLRIKSFIGCLPEEGLKPQWIEIDCYLFFAQAPDGLTSDKLSGTVCYAHCVEIIRKTAGEKHYCLIEHLAYCIREQLVCFLPPGISVSIRVNKMYPPDRDIKHGVSFTLA